MKGLCPLTSSSSTGNAEHLQHREWRATSGPVGQDLAGGSHLAHSPQARERFIRDLNGYGLQSSDRRQSVQMCIVRVASTNPLPQEIQNQGRMIRASEIERIIDRNGCPINRIEKRRQIRWQVLGLGRTSHQANHRSWHSLAGRVARRGHRARLVYRGPLALPADPVAAR